MEQKKADKEVARLLGISTAHSILLREINDSVDGAPSLVLTNPEKILGDQAPTVLTFWHHLDRMDAAAWADAGAEPDVDACASAELAARYAAAPASWGSAWSAVVAAMYAGVETHSRSALAAAGATTEIQHAAVMRANSWPFYFLPLFRFRNPEALMAYYG